MTPRPTAWHAATVSEVRPETATARRITLDVPSWPGNDAGSHLDIRLTAPDGYQASRSYSIASSGESTSVVLAVDEVPDGEISPFLVHDLRPGDLLEVHGPLGNYFIWDPAGSPAHVQLIAGGSGVVPLFAMAEAHGRGDDTAEFRLLYSVRTPSDRFFAPELTALSEAARLELSYQYTRSTPEGWPSTPGRVTRDLLAASTWPADVSPAVFVCGPTPFVEAVSIGSWNSDTIRARCAPSDSEVVDVRVDGNAAAGALAEIFGRDVSLAVATCSHCGRSGPVAGCMAYVTAMGTVLRCAGCDDVLAVLVGDRGTYRLSMTGIRSLQVPNSDALPDVLAELRRAETELAIDAERREDF